MKNKLAEYIKTALIIILSASAVFLGWRTNLFSELFKSIPFFGSVAELVKSASGDETGTAAAKEAARPLCIIVTDKDGQRYGAKYDVDARNSLYDRTSNIIGDALGSATSVTEVSEEEWRLELSGSCVFYEYMIPVQLSLLDFWLGANMAKPENDMALRRVFVTFGKEKNRLYYQDCESGLFYRAATASSAGMEFDLEIYSPNGALFAYEIGIRRMQAAPYYVIVPDSAKKTVTAAVSGPPEEILIKTLAAFGHSNEIYTTSFTGNEGAMTCISLRFNIVIDPNGSVAYRLTDPPREAGSLTLSKSEMIEQARRITAEMTSAASGGAEVFFESIEHSGENSGTVYFSYYIAGGRIYLTEDKPAAKITFIDGVITEAELVFRTYATAEDYTGLLPEIQALAAADSEFFLCYSDNGRETLQPFWLPRTVES